MQDMRTALCDPNRRAALASLWGGEEYCACELMVRPDASQSCMSRHIKLLREAGFVLVRRDRLWVRYRRNPDFVAEFTAVIDAVLAAEHKLELEVA